MTTAVAQIHEGRLSWPFLLPKECRALDSMEEDQQEAIYTMAAEFLWRWTGRRYGIGEVTTYPIRRFRNSAKFGSTFYGRGPFGPRQWAWPGTLSESSLAEFDPTKIFLQNAIEVAEVRLDDQVLDPEDYTLRDSVLTRTDGKKWPSAQSPELKIVYTSGVEVPKGGQVATGVLACEFAMAVTNDGNCSLPQRLQSVTREGVTMTVMDEFDDLDDGRTGIWLIDNWVASVTKAPRGASVLSPNNPRFGGIR